MPDETLMVEGNGSIYLAGPYLVKAAIGEDIDNETLGGAETHTEISGIADYKFNTEEECMDHIKRMMGMLGEKPNSEFEQFKEDYGKTIVCGYARIEGWAVGIVANQRKIVKSRKGEMQMGGVIYNDSADKAARFILNCNQKKIPLVFLQDVTGFMVGSRSEHSGIIKDGAKMVNAVANSVVPKFTIVMGNSYVWKSL